MKKILSLLFVAIALMSCDSTKNVTIENPANFERTEMVEIPVNKLMTLPNGKDYQVITQTGEILPSQLTYDGKLIFQAKFNPNETLSFVIKTGTPQSFPAKTYGRFIKERKDDFAWENDRVAFRIYGQALIPTDGPSNGLDLWYKRTSDLIIDKWYKDDLAGIRSYHNDNGEGLDDYKVGRTLGAGMMAPVENGTVVLNENFTTQEIMENGPLRTTFKLTYKDITVNNKTFSESRTFSIDAGSQLTKVTQEYGTKEEIVVAAGIVKRSEEDQAFDSSTDGGVRIILYEEPESEKVGKVFVTMVFPKGLERISSVPYTIIHPKTKREETHIHTFGITKYYPEQPITYYTGFGWNKFGYPTFNDFGDHIISFADRLDYPLIINVLQ
jgi:hypothetical protein